MNQKSRPANADVVLQMGVMCRSCDRDPGLNTARGWDNVTGVGTPKAQAFADFFCAQ